MLAVSPPASLGSAAAEMPEGNVADRAPATSLPPEGNVAGRAPAASLPPDRRALAFTAGALAVGTLVALLTWQAAPGLGWAIADVALVGVTVAWLGRGRPGLGGWVLAGTSSWLAFMVAWRAADWTLATALPASVAMLGALALVCAKRLPATALADVAPATLDALRTLPGGILDASALPGRILDGPRRHAARSVVGGVILGLPVASLVALLLVADTSFLHALLAAFSHVAEALSLAMWIAICGGTGLVAACVLSRLRPTTPSNTTAADRAPYRAPGAVRSAGDVLSTDAPPSAAIAPPEPLVRPLTWAVVLLQIAGVFGVFALANGRMLFAGDGVLRSPGTTTYAQYVHEGFENVAVAVLLAVACVVTGHTLLRPRLRVGRARHAVPGAGAAGGWRLAVIELTLLAFVGLALASSVHRLHLYEEAYGVTELRLAVRFFQVGVAGLIALTAARCVLRAWGGWPSALAWSGVAMALFAGSFDADGWVATQSAALVRAGLAPDIAYLSLLSEDARGALPELADAPMPPFSLMVLRSDWNAQARAHRSGGWRSWRGLGSARDLPRGDGRSAGLSSASGASNGALASGRPFPPPGPFDSWGPDTAPPLPAHSSVPFLSRAEWVDHWQEAAERPLPPREVHSAFRGGASSTRRASASAAGR